MKKYFFFALNKVFLFKYLFFPNTLGDTWVFLSWGRFQEHLIVGVYLQKYLFGFMGVISLNFMSCFLYNPENYMIYNTYT